MELQLMAVGDSENDIPMFEEADIAVCMGNGTDLAKERQTGSQIRLIMMDCIRLLITSVF